MSVSLRLRKYYYITMVKRKNVEEDATGTKRRRQSIISSDDANPIDQNSISQCFKTISVKMYAAVAPIYAMDAAEGIRQQYLDPLIMNYYNLAGGVVLSYSNLRLLGQNRNPTKKAEPAFVKIINDSSYGHTWMLVDMLVWAPTRGDQVEGWISVQSPSHIALLIHNTFNATIRREDIPPDWYFVPKQDEEDSDTRSLGYWYDADGQPIDGKLSFAVKHFKVSGKTVLVQGSLLTSDDVRLPTIGEEEPAEVSAAHVKFDNGPVHQLSNHLKFDDGGDTQSADTTVTAIGETA